MSPLWKFLPAELAHQLAPLALRVYSQFHQPVAAAGNAFTWKGLSFSHRLGIAGGVDKNAELLPVWQKLNAGFVEIGTVTPEPQKANPGKIIDRDWDKKNLWNKMGFPNHGGDEVFYNIRSQKEEITIPLFVNIGKNRSTPNEYAVHDYLRLVDRFSSVADVFVVNVSSPNTSGLRDLQSKQALADLTAQVVQLSKKPVLVKLSPDLDEAVFKESLEACLQSQVSGFILTNTTTHRPSDCRFPREGGLSGQDLKSASLQALKWAKTYKTKDLLLVSVGGILSSQDVAERLSLGADLVQVYSALIFKGPGFFSEVLRELKPQH